MSSESKYFRTDFLSVDANGDGGIDEREFAALWEDLLKASYQEVDGETGELTGNVISGKYLDSETGRAYAEVQLGSADR